MTRTRHALIFLAFSAGPLPAMTLQAPVPLCAIAAELATDLARLTPYAAPQGCPEITFSLPAKTGIGPQQAASYDLETGQIRLAADVDLTTTYGKSILLHELVHAAQVAAGRLQHCPTGLEYEAYAAQAQYLRDHGLSEAARTTVLLGAMLSSCGSETY